MDDASAITVSEAVCRDWQECLGVDWPHAIGCDGQGPLVWETKTFRSWEDTMRSLAEVRLGVNHCLELVVGSVKKPSERHLVAYPRGEVNRRPNVVQSWKSDSGELRLPNSLRLKVLQKAAGQYVGRVVHIPCKPTDDFKGVTAGELVNIWRKVHSKLDHADTPVGRFNPFSGAQG
jgi:CRISPR-associated protein Cmr1